MKQAFLKAIDFIRQNPSMIFSLILVVIIPTAFFINTYSITSRFEENIDKITQTNAITIENVINAFSDQQLEDAAVVQKMLERIAKENENIIDLAILKPNNQTDMFQIVASSDESAAGQETEDIQTALAWKQPEGIAMLSENEKGRYWKVIKSINDANGTKYALISLSFSLADSDKLIDSTINRAYVILALTILVVILFVSNQARLFGYALTLTKLKEIDQMKDDFISMASHDLRSPLAAIKGYLEFLKDKPAVVQDEESNHYVTNISLSVDRLGNLVNDMLEVSRLEGNRIPITITAFDPAALIKQSVEELRSQAVIKKLELKFENGTDSALSADAERLKQVMINLIGNAIKYTFSGSVKISTQTKNKEYLITVADTGMGISSENQANLFKKFYRVKNEKTKDIIGTGLGLWITQELIRRMNGYLTVESIEGVGSHFTVHLPAAEKEN
jgi:signal transduction histidine kinase